MKTASKRAYPGGLCRLLATAVLDDLAPRGWVEEGEEERTGELEPMPAELMELPPALGAEGGAATAGEEGWRDLDSAALRQGRAKDETRRARRAAALASAAAGDGIVAHALAAAGASARD